MRACGQVTSGMLWGHRNKLGRVWGDHRRTGRGVSGPCPCRKQRGGRGHSQWGKKPDLASK